MSVNGGGNINIDSRLDPEKTGTSSDQVMQSKTAGTETMIHSRTIIQSTESITTYNGGSVPLSRPSIGLLFVFLLYLI